MHAKAVIALCMTPSQRMLIKGAETGFEAMAKLYAIYDTKDEATKLEQKGMFLRMAMDRDQNVITWVARVENEYSECLGSGINLDASDKVRILLQGLTDAFTTTKKVILTDATRSGTSLSFESVTRILLADEAAKYCCGKQTSG